MGSHALSRIIVADDSAVLVWTTDATLEADSRPLSYRGASILAFESDLIAQFETFYDSAAFVRPSAPSETAGGSGEPQPTYAAI